MMALCRAVFLYIKVAKVKDGVFKDQQVWQIVPARSCYVQSYTKVETSFGVVYVMAF